MAYRILIFLAALTGSAAASDSCLAPADARTAVAEHHLINVQQATRVARGKAKGEVVSANLCRVNQRFMYVLAILSPEGRVARIGVDAVTGSATLQR